ncbi:MAG: hypothetical protein D3923_03445, partial [Candidatus Electrothrix sp. AR3]|nr:hypothetical protein [Candidatus Electrothrix sp. AR3]
LETDTRSVLKFYWPDEQGRYSENQAAQLLIKPGKTKYQLRVTDISGLDHLRLDPSENKFARVSIRTLQIKQVGYPNLQLQSKEDFSRLELISGVETMMRHPQGGVTLDIHSLDPQLKLVFPAMEKQISWLDELKPGIFLLLLAAGCYYISIVFSNDSSFIPLLSLFVLALILVMATISDFNTHPDEIVHVAAGSYYKEHNLPPRVGDPAIEHTYSAYGVSRLHSGEIYYFLAGKYLQALNSLHSKPYKALRLFNVLLFCSLILYAFQQVDFRFFLLPLLISPQIWYVFSYFDSDAFALFVSMLGAYQLAAENSALNALLRDQPGKWGWVTPLTLGLLFGLLLLQKLNFYFLYIFFLFYFIWRIRIVPLALSKRMIFRFITLVLVGCSLFASFRVVDAWVNDFKKEQLTFQARETYGKDIYKPSTPLEKKHAYLQMRDRGKTLQEMLRLDSWGEKSFRSSFGVYGYTQYSGSFSYYDYVRMTTLLLLLSLIISVVYRGGISGNALLGIAGGCAACFFAGLIYHAWTADFQAQGRYLLPLVPMLAILSYHFQRIIIRPIFYSLFFILFSLGVYNFIFVGLHDIGKSAI